MRAEKAHALQQRPKNMVYVALRACTHACKQGMRAAGFHCESCENRVFGWEAVFTFFSIKHLLIQKQARSRAHVAFRACQDRASVNANMYGNLMREAHSDMFWSVLEENHGLGMDSLLSVCSWNANAIKVLAWMLWSAYAPGTRAKSWFGHGCSGQRMLLALGTRTELWFGHGCSGQRMLLDAFCKNAEVLTAPALRALPSPRNARNTARASKFGLGRGR